MDERAALEELERLRDQVQRYRARRRALGDDFDRLVGSFKKTPVPQPREAVAEQPRHKAIHDAALAAGVELPPAPAAAPVRKPAGARAGMLVGGTLVLLAVAVLVIWSLWTRAPATDGTAARRPGPAAADRAPGKPTAPAGDTSELTTIRPVWVRVVVDGKVVVERQLPANARVAVAARKSIVIRAGDAGAVRLRLRGRDQGTLGGAGQVVTRRFDVPPASQ